MKTSARSWIQAKSKSWWIGGIASSILMTLFFQNCGQNTFFAASLTTTLSPSHPDVEIDQATPKKAAAQSQVLIGDRLYVESVFRNVFLSENPSAVEEAWINGLFYSELTPMQHLFGRSCDTATLGTLHDCYYLAANQSTRLGGASSSGRQAARMQICRLAVSDEAALERAVAKIRGQDRTPNGDSIRRLVGLFYPAMDEARLTEFASALRDLDEAMAKNAEKIKDRWRLLVLTVCETPGWEVL